MNTRMLGGIVGVAALLSGCNSVGTYPKEWHAANDGVHVYGAVAEQVVPMPAGDQPLTLLDLCFRVGGNARLSPRVVVFRAADPTVLRIDVDVLRMVRTGVTTENIVLRPGDVVWMG